jgi:hypothetical protein
VDFLVGVEERNLCWESCGVAMTPPRPFEVSYPVKGKTVGNESLIHFPRKLFFDSRHLCFIWFLVGWGGWCEQVAPRQTQWRKSFSKETENILWFCEY